MVLFTRVSFKVYNRSFHFLGIHTFSMTWI